MDSRGCSALEVWCNLTEATHVARTLQVEKCPDGFSYTEKNLVGKAGTFYPGMSVILECATTCLEDSSCSSFEINKGGYGCWTYSGGLADISDVTQKPGWTSCIRSELVPEVLLPTHDMVRDSRGSCSGGPIDSSFMGVRLQGRDQSRFKAVRDLMKTEEALPASFGSCAVVGSSGSLALDHFGPEIDAHDAIMRFGAAPTKGFEEQVGSRTTFRLIAWTAAHALAYQGKHYFSNWLSPVTRQGNPEYLLFNLVKKLDWIENHSKIVEVVRSVFPNTSFTAYTPEMAEYQQKKIRFETGSQIEDQLSGMSALIFFATVCETINIYGFSNPFDDRDYPCMLLGSLSS